MNQATEGPLSRLLEAFTTPLTPVDYVTLVNPLRGREVRGQITSIEKHDDFLSLTLTPGPGMPRTFHAGQFIGLGLQIDGRWRWRCYSLTNAPQRRGRSLTVSIKPVPGGLFTQHIADNAEVGQVIRLTAPGGDFYLPQPVPRKLLFLTAGAGITPVMSMLRWLKQEFPPQSDSDDDSTSFPDVIHVHSERASQPAAPYGEELQTLHNEVPNYHLITWDTTQQGRLTVDTFKDLVPDATTRQFYACGPTQMLDSFHDEFPDMHSEKFFIEVDGNNHGGDIHFSTLGVSTTSTGSTTVLEAAEAAGVNLMHGCRMGICRTCVTPIEDGAAVDLRDGHTYGPGEQIRTCCTVPAGTLTIAGQ
ncbi:flavin reductase family protein [Corynebacterium anserum]|uniref:2Fe-2S iron-sulfur cluster binding domain-containing protein n=2 Tax=Corynebacterium anserum TaxID=2684406 RepID=A0A7G7YQP7_9CORY|nr:iron-sulfur cluster-binding domain-containing protein [Corynebacterium anserum]MBC2682528.1 2Fe-2S iron-sulfur cluster binding domain-containing protein [Corynebacterium anserum]QNH96817.1 2Fe-2S iron-sulfur cluster binding domain-containing protein [Corynebacterium anserum]